jgi:integrase/recombinase XerD
MQSSGNENIDLINNFLASLSIDKSLNTISSYENDLHLFLKFLIIKKKNLASSNENDVSEYFSQYFFKDKYNFIKIAEATTVRRKISCFRLFFGYLVETGLISKNPIEEVEVPKKATNLPFYLTQDEVEALFEYTTSLNTKDGIRINAILRILYSSGLRVSEAITMKIDDVLAQDGSVKKKVIVLGKGNKERMIFLDKPTQIAVEKYLTIRDVFKPSKSNRYLFCSQSKAGHVSRENIFISLQKVAYKANLPDRLSPHKLRHSFATHMYQHGMDLRMLQILLGHSDISTTEIYTHIKADEIKETIEKFHPLFNK